MFLEIQIIDAAMKQTPNLTDNGKKTHCSVRGLSKYFANIGDEKESLKEKNYETFVESHLLWMPLVAVHSRGKRKNGIKRAAMESPGLIFQKLDYMLE